jgi:hypothetical protein
MSRSLDDVEPQRIGTIGSLTDSFNFLSTNVAPLRCQASDFWDGDNLPIPIA